MQARKSFSDMNKIRKNSSLLSTYQSFRERLGISNAKTDREAVSRTIPKIAQKDTQNMYIIGHNFYLYAKFLFVCKWNFR
jgi:hypothetical protein